MTFTLTKSMPKFNITDCQAINNRSICQLQSNYIFLNFHYLMSKIFVLLPRKTTTLMNQIVLK